MMQISKRDPFERKKKKSASTRNLKLGDKRSPFKLKRTRKRQLRNEKNIDQTESKVIIEEPEKDIVRKKKKDSRASWDIVWKNTIEELENWVTKGVTESWNKM
ncbi:8589_t:CDS:2 [Gigaspora rosea]|nr:8589_t:CDS:2 [Gigaspora rosea]